MSSAFSFHSSGRQQSEIAFEEVSDGANPKPLIHIDITTDEFSGDPYGLYSALRGECPVAWSTGTGGFWMLTDYASASDAIRDPASFTSTRGTTVRESDIGPNREYLAKPVGTDPPDTLAYRKVTLPALSPGATQRAEPMIRRLVDELIDDFIEVGETELTGSLLNALPAQVILSLYGMDPADWKIWVGLMHDVIQGETVEKTVAASEEAYRRIYEVLASRQDRDDPGDDVLGMLVKGMVHGARMSLEDQAKYLFVLIAGGVDTTGGLAANTIVVLDRDHALRQQLIERRSSLGRAIEELIRLNVPTQGIARSATRDICFHGQQMREGDRVMVMLASANRDPAVFDRPEEVDLDRHPNRHMSFGGGDHRCIGSNLARAMFRIMLESILSRLPDFQINDAVEYYENASMVYIPRRLQIKFTPGKRVSRSPDTSEPSDDLSERSEEPECK